MSGVERGAPDQYEITWRTGHVESILAHQVTWPNRGFGVFGNDGGRPGRMHFHAEIDGRWTLTLAADEEDILTIRRTTDAEPIPDGAA